MFNFGMGELLVILLIILLLFGAKRLPEIARALGNSIKEFKKASSAMKDAMQEKPPGEETKDKTKES